METRRLITAMLTAMAVFFAFQFIVAKFRPAPPPPTPDAERVTASPETGGTTADADTPAPGDQRDQRDREVFTFAPGTSVDAVILGGGPEDHLRAELTPRGAAVANLWLTARRGTGEDREYVYRQAPREDEPYHLLQPVFNGDDAHHSFVTHRIIIKERGDEVRPVDDLNWQVVPAAAGTDASRTVVFQTTLRSPDDPARGLLRLTKTYELLAGQPLINLTLAVENLSDQQLTVSIEQDGPLGIPREQAQYDMRRLIAAFNDSGTVRFERARARGDLVKASLAGQKVLYPDNGRPFAWTALTDRFFAVFTRVVPPGNNGERVILRVEGLAKAPRIPDKIAGGDLVARLTTVPLVVAPGQTTARTLEIYAGPKDPDLLAAVNPAFADPAAIGYSQAQFADRTCMCTFGWLTNLMKWLLHSIYGIIPNYGVAIIILVLIVRTLLHPLSVFQQKSMFRTQEGMVRLQPKMQAIKEKYANDRNKQNQEMMKLFSEEGVNPAANFVSMIPMFIQMPILVAMWMALNDDVQLRHAPFAFWITDLSQPDALWTFAPPGLTLPLLGWLVSWFRDIPALNLLPLLMGVSMYLQQKYMPKPGQAARHEARQKQAAAEGGESMVEQQLRQQRIIAGMMSVLFPVMFYYMPSGLNLYWMSTTVFGIGESLIIRRQIDREKTLKAQLGPQAAQPKRTGFIGRTLKNLAEQANELQRKADELSKQEPPRKDRPRKGR